MRLDEFLEEVDLKEDDIISYEGEEALRAIYRSGFNLKYVHKQTSEICLVAVKENGSALQYVRKQTPEICLAAVKKEGYALRFVCNQTPEICLEAVRNNRDALQFVDKSIFEEPIKELTVDEISELLGYKIKVIGGE